MITFNLPELNAGGAKRDACQALPAEGQLWPSDDDDDDDTIMILESSCEKDKFRDVVFQQANSNGKKKKYLGKIKYRVDYDFITSTLTVTVIECKVRIHYEQQNES